MNILVTIIILLISLPMTTFAKKNIQLIATGGGISSRQISASDSAFSDGFLTIDALIQLVPDIRKIANISSDQIMNVKSQNMTSEGLLTIAKTVQKYVDDSKTDAVIVTHGTDTLEETAYFLNLVINTKKPIIVTGATRSSNHIGSDAHINLFESVVVAASDMATSKGVLIVSNSKIIGARGMKKISTNGTFSLSTNDTGFLGYVFNKKPYFYHSSVRKHTYQSEFNINSISKLPNVSIIYSNTGVSSKVVQAILDQSAGVVVAGVGNGNISDKVVSVLSDNKNKAIQVVKSSRTGAGVIIPSTEVNDKKLGFITADNLSPQQARILLMVSLAKTKNKSMIQDYFDTY
ncbi:MAG: asparaginase [Candidatus Marinamargulisbacteria bacterium]